MTGGSDAALVPGTRAAEDAADAELAEAFARLNPELAKRAAMRALELDALRRENENLKAALAAAAERADELLAEADAQAERYETTIARIEAALLAAQQELADEKQSRADLLREANGYAEELLRAGATVTRLQPVLDAAKKLDADWQFTDRDDYSIRYPGPHSLVALRDALVVLAQDAETRE